MNPIAQLALLGIVRTIAAVALALSLFVLPVALSVRYTATSASWWERGFERYDATRRTGLPQDEVLRVAAETREYLANDEERLDVSINGAPFYSEREILHMIDVKRLMSRVYDAGWAALGFIIAFVSAMTWRNRAQAMRVLAQSTLSACGIVTTLVMILGVLGLTGFDSAFRSFHLIFFTNDLWQLDSSDGLIQLFPQHFFFDTTILIGGATLGFIVVLGALSVITLRRSAGQEIAPPAS